MEILQPRMNGSDVASTFNLKTYSITSGEQTIDKFLATSQRQNPADSRRNNNTV